MRTKARRKCARLAELVMDQIALCLSVRRVPETWGATPRGKRHVGRKASGKTFRYLFDETPIAYAHQR